MDQRGPFTNVLAGATFLSFLIVQLGGLTDQAAVIAGFIPARVHAFAAQGLMLHVSWLPVWLTPLSATLVHGGWLHVGLNLVILIFCGRGVEQVIGGWRMLFVYVVGAYVAAGAQWAIDPASASPMIGASGAISAVLAAYAVYYGQRRARAIGPIPEYVVRAIWYGLAWIGIQLLVGFAGGLDPMLAGIAIAAHIGGFVIGLLLARPMLYARFGRRRT